MPFLASFPKDYNLHKPPEGADGSNGFPGIAAGVSKTVKPQASVSGLRSYQGDWYLLPCESMMPP